jgi:hypothetical protein
MSVNGIGPHFSDIDNLMSREASRLTELERVLDRSAAEDVDQVSLGLGESFTERLVAKRLPHLFA